MRKNIMKFLIIRDDHSILKMFHRTLLILIITDNARLTKNSNLNIDIQKGAIDEAKNSSEKFYDVVFGR